MTAWHADQYYWPLSTDRAGRPGGSGLGATLRRMAAPSPNPLLFGTAEHTFISTTVGTRHAQGRLCRSNYLRGQAMRL
jgi:hypothetical protein